MTSLIGTLSMEELGGLSKQLIEQFMEKSLSCPRTGKSENWFNKQLKWLFKCLYQNSQKPNQVLTRNER
jgi:hypothetical protein